MCFSFSKDDRDITLNGLTVNEQDFGGCERWYAVDKYTYDELYLKVRIQVGYFRENNIGFILYDDGTVGEVAQFSRQGMDLRWDWGEYERDGKIMCPYAFVIEADGTGLYYDFSTSNNGISKPRGIYQCTKF